MQVHDRIGTGRSMIAYQPPTHFMLVQEGARIRRGEGDVCVFVEDKKKRRFV